MSVKLSDLKLYGDTKDYTYYTDQDGCIVHLNKLENNYYKQKYTYNEQGKMTGAHNELIEVAL